MVSDSHLKTRHMSIQRDNLSLAAGCGDRAFERHPVAESGIAVVGIYYRAVGRGVNRLPGRTGNIYAVMERVTQSRKTGVAVTLRPNSVPFENYLSLLKVTLQILLNHFFRHLA